MSFIFTKTLDKNNPYDNTTVSMEVGNDDIQLPDLLDIFERFLRAVGYVVPNGKLSDAFFNEKTVTDRPVGAIDPGCQKTYSAIKE